MNRLSNRAFTMWCAFLVLTSLSLIQAADSFKMPVYLKFKMDNGLTVYLMEQHEVPLIYATTVLKVGSVNDGKQFGLASLTLESLKFNTKNYSKEQIEDTFDFLGADLSFSGGREASQLKLSFAKTDSKKILPLWRELVTEPRFDESEFKKFQQRSIMQLEQAKESPRNVIRNYFNTFLFSSSAYANPPSGNKETVAALSINDIKAFYKAHYAPQNCAIIVAGDFETKAMKIQIKELFGQWKNPSPQKAPVYGKTKAATQSRVLLVNKEDSHETTFYIGHSGIKRSNPDYTQIQVVNTILGGRFTSWLNDELRVNSGLTYGAGSGFSPYKEAGTFVISSFTKTATTTEAIDLALEVVNRLHTKGIDETTLSSAKNYVKGQFPPRYETAGDMADLLASMYVYNFSDEYINDFTKNVDLMSTTEAARIIEKYFPNDNWQFVLIGKASEIRDKAKKYGTLSEKDIREVGF